MTYGHQVREPLELLYDKWTKEENVEQLEVLPYIQKLRRRMEKVTKHLLQKDLEMKAKQKIVYDKNAKPKSFEVGSKVMYFKVCRSNKLEARLHGPYLVKENIDDVNYI